MDTKEHSNVLSEDAFIKKYMEEFEVFYKQHKLIFQHSDDMILKLYEMLCNSEYSQYVQRLTTMNDPGLIM